MSAFNAITRQTSRVCCQATSIQSLAFVWQVLCPAGTGAFLFMLFWTPARESLRGQYSGRLKAGLSFERGEAVPCGHGAFLFMLFWTPARESLRGQYSGRLKAGLSFERGGCALRARGLFTQFSFGRLRGGRCRSDAFVAATERRRKAGFVL